MVTRPCTAKHCGEFGPATEVVEGGVAGWPFVFSWSRTRARALPSDRWGGAAAAAAAAAACSVCSIGHPLVSSPANWFLSPLPLTVCCCV